MFNWNKKDPQKKNEKINKPKASGSGSGSGSGSVLDPLYFLDYMNDVSTSSCDSSSSTYDSSSSCDSGYGGSGLD